MEDYAGKRAPKYLAYLRVSTREQGDSGLGLDAQRAQIQREAEARGWTLVREFVDVGVSGKSLLGRPALAAALELVTVGAADGLVSAKLDRLSRSVLDFASLASRAKVERWNLVALDLGIDMSTPAGRLMANVMASFAEHERDLIAQRTADALASLRQQGVRLGRPPALPRAVVARVVGSAEAGLGPTAIAHLLNEDKVPTAHGGRVWWPGTVRAVLRSQMAADVLVANHHE